jgi:hypothetical protein
MPTKNGEYVPLTEGEIYERLKQNFEAQFDQEISVGDLVEKQLQAQARTLEQNQEQALQKVYEAGYLEEAGGKELDKVVGNIGLTRREAVQPTGVVRYGRRKPAKASYTIPRGSVVQTGGSDPLEYSTRETAKLTLIDDWESNDLTNWTGDTGSFSIESTNPIAGSCSLSVPATDGVVITSTDESFTRGTTFGCRLNPASGSVTAFQFGKQGSGDFLEAVVHTGGDDLRLRYVANGTQQNSATSNVTVPTDESSYVEFQWSHYEELHCTVYGSEERDTEVGSVTLPAPSSWSEGSVGIKSKDSTATALIDSLGTREVLVNIRAEQGGVESNVGTGRITVDASGVPGVESVKNPVAVGDGSYDDLNDSPLIVGRKREDDEELRQRAFDNTSIGGAATLDALGTEINRIEGVQSLTMRRNRSESTVNGLPPHSFEAIVYGGENEDIANTIHGTMSIDSTDHGGAFGTEVTYDIESDITGQTETIHWSRPTEVALNITVELIVDDGYIGDDVVASRIVEYIGGTDVDGNQLPGLDVGENVYENVLGSRLVDPAETGVWEMDSITIDADGDGTDDTTTLASGADVYAVANNEVATANARDGTITVNTTQK